jgi:hypothetical protein
MGGKSELVIYDDMKHVGPLLALADAPFLYFAPVLNDITRFIKCNENKAVALSSCFAQDNLKDH